MRFNKLLPELSVSNLERSLDFYVKTLGFKIEYQRPEDKFAFLSYNGSQIMLEETSPKGDPSWYTGKLAYPGGRGIHFQIDTKNIGPLIRSLKKNKYKIKCQPKEYWYRKDNRMLGMKGFLVMDPDGYLLLFNQDLGSKPVTKNCKP